ncbi:MAG: hypothetical protein JTT11_04195, partial [Candidatus Brockarchaeota archaeon]|nr:hypothetical protein [Candidatus Brockarchaeota archaeon]
SGVFRGRNSPAMLVSLDWTNAFRGKEHPLPMARLEHLVISSAEEALALGASGVTSYFFIGHEDDEREARNMEALSAICRECDDLEVPILVQAIPVGERVTAENYADSLALASRMAVEAGADMLAIPYAGKGGFGRVVEASRVPVLLLDLELKMSRGQPEYDFELEAPEALRAGCSGLLLGRRYLKGEKAADIERMVKLVHGG